VEDIVRAICQQEGIPSRNIQVLSGGQVNAVFRVDREYVVRIGMREDAYQRLKRETDLLRSLAGEIPVPKILAFGLRDGFVYQIQQYLPGHKLYSVWNTLRPVEQETVVAQLVDSLKILHRRTTSSFGSAGADVPQFASWSDYLSDKFNQTLQEIQRLNIRILPGFVELATTYFEEHRHVLQNSLPCLVHGDLTLVNVLVDQGQLSAVLDFEYALQAPKDYELWTMEAFCLYPNDWAEVDHAVCCTADFTGFFPLFQKYYPEMFETPHLRERVNLYQLDAALGSYLAWRKDNISSIPPERMAAKEFYMARITNFIFRHGTRMFFGQ